MNVKTETEDGNIRQIGGQLRPNDPFIHQPSDKPIESEYSVKSFELN